MLLDMGLTPTLSREAARFNGGALSALDLRRLVRAFEGIFLAVGVAGALVLIAGAGLIADHWLKVQQLDLFEVQRAVMLMAVIVALRWIGGLYRGAVSGFERIVWLSGYNIVIATLRFVLVVPFLIHVGATPTHFFGYQLVVAVIELVVIVAKTYRLLPAVSAPGWIRWEWRPLRGVMRFALSAALTSAIWVLVTQTDKLVLSGLLSLSEYAIFTLAMLVASGIALLSSPITGAILPRLTKLNAQGDEAGVIPPVPRRHSAGGRDRRARRAGAGLLPAAGAECLDRPARGGRQGRTGADAVRGGQWHPRAGGLSLLPAGGARQPQPAPDRQPDLRAAVRAPAAAGGHPLRDDRRRHCLDPSQPTALPGLATGVHHHFLKGLNLRWLTQDIGAIALLPTIAAALAAQLIDWPPVRWVLVPLLIALYVGLALAAACSSSTVRARLRGHLSMGMA